MNDPYPRLAHLDIAAIEEWNAGIKRSRAKDAAHPFACCKAYKCDQVTAGSYCLSHARANGDASRRMRRSRSAT